MIAFDGFIDAYYAWDSNRPAGRERGFTTQAVRHDEPNINLLSGGATIEAGAWRVRLALQGGNSVSANTRLEPNPVLGHIQEAYVGRRIGERTWLDGGVYLAHIGAESWISKNNLTYTRALNLDYVPYYAAGLRLAHDTAGGGHVELHVMNGWQNISETNAAKALGLQLRRRAGGETYTYNSFYGDENVFPDSRPRFRTYHNFILETRPRDGLTVQASLDVGTEAGRVDGVFAWGATALTLGQRFDEKNAAALRFERYVDPHQANVRTGTRNGFRVSSASVNYDRTLGAGVLWRMEFRGYRSEDAIFPGARETRARTDALLVTALTVSF
jgi:hypothetical protein